jgi:ubiquinone/menaquinone biosynthesis C-methylase UbiE
MGTGTPREQTIEAKRAEARRPFHGASILEEPRLATLQRERAARVLEDVRQFGLAPPALTPFLEIGAGSGQRSIALANRLGADGVATDISVRSLRDAPFVGALIGGERLPMRIACDAHHLPFLDDSVRLVLAYQTLHHFEDPRPVFAEALRVLGRGGHLVFNEEPLDSPVRRALRGRRMLVQPRTRVQRWAERAGVEKIFWDDGDVERSLGMTEARFDFPLWRQCLRDFELVELEVNRVLRLRVGPDGATWRRALAAVVGGNVRGLCRKPHGEPAGDDFRARLRCLDCGRAGLSADEPGLRCPTCDRRYPVEDGVLRMLPQALEQALYDGVVRAGAKGGN